MFGVAGNRQETAVSGDGRKSGSNQQDRRPVEHRIPSFHREPFGVSGADPRSDQGANRSAVFHA